MFSFNFSDIGSVTSSCREQNEKLASQMSLIQTTKKFAKKFAQRTVPARKLCLHASLALDARCFSWLFIEAQKILQTKGGALMFYKPDKEAYCAAHQSYPGQGATHEGLSLWINVSHYSYITSSSQATLLQTQTLRSQRSRRQREPIVHAQCAYVAIWETAATYNICATTLHQ